MNHPPGRPEGARALEEASMNRLLVAAAAVIFSLAPALAQNAAPPATPASPPAASAATATPAAPAAGNLLDPKSLTEKAPATFVVRLDTSKGPVDIAVHRDWAPNGADRFYNLVKNGFFTNASFFRVVPGFMVQFGVPADPKVAIMWRSANITDDPVTQSNKRGYVTFATAGPNTRTTQIFINTADNPNLDKQGFAPFGMVVAGMAVVDQFYSGYGDGPPFGRGPDQSVLQAQGNDYLAKSFPKLDSIKTAAIQQ
jgi:peptidyl-prolyl cis-trans isomerase A (cyclophilin A)